MSFDILDGDGLEAALARREQQLLRERLVLYAGANMPAERTRSAYAASLSAYPAMGPSHHKEQPDTGLVSDLEVAVRGRIQDVFGAAWAEPRLPSCTLANLAVFHAFARPGDVLLAPAAAHGGHLSQRRGGTPELAGLVVHDLPFDAAACCLDAAAAARQVEALRPRLVMLGRSVMVMPDDIGPVVQAARRVGAITIFDASHVAGLIAGGVYPNPLEAGVDILTSSTYKTLPGRPQGLVMGADTAHGALFGAFADRYLLANYDAGKLPALYVMLGDVARGGEAYARRVVDAASALAEALRKQGLPVIAPAPGQRHTHQVLVPLAEHCDPRQAVAHLEQHGVLAGTCAEPTRAGRHALRLGTQFLATQGLGAEAMGRVAELLSRLLQPGPDRGANLRVPTEDISGEAASAIRGMLSLGRA